MSSQKTLEDLRRKAKNLEKNRDELIRQLESLYIVLRLMEEMDEEEFTKSSAT